ncbi:MAG: ScyD/ScyE family protein [Thermomicrobiales bacterium]|nr:ScyD/ScyE family protein [Thermomicrobiales bacterium]
MDRKQVFSSRVTRRSFAAGSLASAVMLTGGRVISAQDATPVTDATPDTGVTSEVLLTGLADPRFVLVDGSDVYFTESGTGGDEPISELASDGTPAGDPISMAGPSGKVSVLAADGTVTAIADNLRSFTFGESEIVGAAGLALDGNGSLYVAVGAPGPSVGLIELTGNEGVVVKIDLETGEQTVLANLVDYEIANDPDPMAIDSNLYGMSYLDGKLYVADAGGNCIYTVDAETGEIAVFAVTGGIEAPFLPESGNPARGGAREIDSVPSSAVPGPDDRIYVSFVTGGPFPTGLAPVYAYSLDGEKEVFATGLTMTQSLAFSSDGSLYASIASVDLINGQPGQVVRVEADGSLTVVLDGLIIPGGIAFDADDNLYVLEMVTGVPTGGQLVKYTGVTGVVAAAPEPEATPEPEETEPEATPVAKGGAGSSESFQVSMVDTAFEPNALTIPANTDVTINLENTGFLAHDFAMDSPTKIVSDVLGNGGTTSMTLNLEPGTYTFYCTQVGHRQLGMVGTLTVE